LWCKYAKQDAKLYHQDSRDDEKREALDLSRRAYHSCSGIIDI